MCINYGVPVSTGRLGSTLNLFINAIILKQMKLMKRFSYLLILFLAFSCRKNEPSVSLSAWQSDLQQKISIIDFSSLELSGAVRIPYPTGEILYRIPLKAKKPTEEFLLIETDISDHISKGQFIRLQEINDSDPFHYNGSIHFRTFDNRISNYSIVNGKIQYAKNLLAKEAAQELDEVVIICSYAETGINWAYWMNLLSMLNQSSYNMSGWYNDMTYSGGGGGGPTNTQPPVLVDVEHPESKEAIDPKKYTDCFSSIPNDGASFQITIASDIPVDSDPSTFFSWQDGSPGHVFVELYKLGGNGGSVTQSIGFYPNSAWKLVATDNTASKVVDDGSHEYNARYTISVTASQFQAALNTVQTLSTKQYNINTFNCVDWALGVFNSAGANVTIPKYVVPGGSSAINTPQGVYNKISELAINGNSGASTNGKAYGPNSKGPCN
jgi:hypothetical protein